MAPFRRLLLLALGLHTTTACLERPAIVPQVPPDSFDRTLQIRRIDAADILVEVDNSRWMVEHQRQLGRQSGNLIDLLTALPVNPTPGAPGRPVVRSLHVGVISSDLGTPGSVVPTCADADVGDDGLLNPIRQGAAMRAHEPWTTSAAGGRPERCGTSPDQHPAFLAFSAGSSDPVAYAEDFACNALLGNGGCSLQQQLEAVYRALVVHDPHDRPGNTDPNAGFVRDHAVLAIVIVSDEEDMSVRDCRYAERGRPCSDAVSVFDGSITRWSSSDLNLRGYLYRPGSDQDPTWPLDRYIDPSNLSRGFLSLKPGRPDRLVFAAITGVPIDLPMRGRTAIDWDALLGRSGDGSDGYTATTAEGPVSMRQANPDPHCPARVVPSCYQPGVYLPSSPPCDPLQQNFAWPSRRLAQVARRFDETFHNGVLSSICRLDLSGALRQVAERIRQNLDDHCLPRALTTLPPTCGTPGADAGSCADPDTHDPVTIPCSVRETLPEGTCDPEHGRAPHGSDGHGHRICEVAQVPVPLGRRYSGEGHGFFYDTSVDPAAPSCPYRIAFTAGDDPPAGASTVIECSP